MAKLEQERSSLEHGACDGGGGGGWGPRQLAADLERAASSLTDLKEGYERSPSTCPACQLAYTSMVASYLEDKLEQAKTRSWFLRREEEGEEEAARELIEETTFYDDFEVDDDDDDDEEEEEEEEEEEDGWVIIESR